MPVAAARKIAACAWAVALLGVLGCGDDDSAPGRGTSRKDAGGADAAMDAAMDAEVEQPPPPPDPPPRDAGKHDSGTVMNTTPDAAPDAIVTPPVTCADLGCEAMGDECNTVTCDPVALKCVVMPVADDTPCGSPLNDNCSAPDQCKAGVCEPRHKPAGTVCGDMGVDCRVDDACDGEGHCVDHGIAPEGTPCGEQTPSDPTCDAPDACDADGVCQKRNAAVDTPCGDHDVLCRYDDKCDGFGACQDGGLWEAGACPNGQQDGKCVCGRTDQTFCHPEKDLCDPSGTCVLGNLADGTACGNQTPTHAACDQPDSCLAGMCSSNPAPAGTACGDQATNTTCDHKDACDGGGNCDPNYAGSDVVCGAAPDVCGEERKCNGGGTCAAAAFKAMGTVCGPASGECHLERTCSGGSYACPASAVAPEFTPCGSATASDPSCDEPDSCNANGTCNARHVAQGTACGDPDTTECSLPDSCDGNGMCDPHHQPAGTDCGDQGQLCLNDDACNASGQCVDNGYDSPCGLDGVVIANGTGVPNVTVRVIGPGATMTTTDANGEFTLNAPLGQEIQLSAGDAPGYYGIIRARTLTSLDVGEVLSLSLASDDEVTDAAQALSATVDQDKGVVLVFISGSGLSGSEGATISAPSDAPISLNGGNYQRSNTLVSAMPGGLFFYNVTPGTTTVTPINGLANTCQRVSSLASFEVHAHAVTFVDIVCH